MEFSLHEFLSAYPWGLYVCFLIAPFVQEDAAVIGAAASSAAGLGDTSWLLLSILSGLTLSDLWKYWAGRAAVSQNWARKYAEKPGVKNAQEKVVNKPGSSLMLVRFVPDTRIPFYVASGFFEAHFGKFSLFVALSALLYIGIAFALFHTFGEIAGEKAKGWLPAVALMLLTIVLSVQFIRTRQKTRGAL
ncbi:MAG: hypothetical protein AAFN48_01855 [Pseudomonadota bacterium]